jgi:hypothetical protein
LGPGLRRGDTSFVVATPGSRFRRKRYAKENKDTVPIEAIDRILAGESPLRVWRNNG